MDENKMELEDNVIYFKLSVDEEVGAMSLEILDNTIEGSTISNLLSPLAKGISNILEQDPDFLYEAGSQISEGEYVETHSETMH
jgi:hypothetical protein|tara:strand:+ start:1922 stop:2173 length:252 start_codon:yes stop_codon:yes gene_type:complete